MEGSVQCEQMLKTNPCVWKRCWREAQSGFGTSWPGGGAETCRDTACYPGGVDGWHSMNRILPHPPGNAALIAASQVKLQTSHKSGRFLLFLYVGGVLPNLEEHDIDLYIRGKERQLSLSQRYLGSQSINYSLCGKAATLNMVYLV